MKVLTVKTMEIATPQKQLDIHFALRMEHHTDYVFKDKQTDRYSTTISVPDSSSIIDKIIESSTELSDFTIVLDDLDMEANKIVRYTIKNGKVTDKKAGSWEWNG